MVTMDDPLSRGLPFELADIWRRSAFQLKDEDQSLFAPPEASFPSLELDIKRDSSKMRSSSQHWTRSTHQPIRSISSLWTAT